MKLYVRTDIPSNVPYIDIDIDVIYEVEIHDVVASFSNIRPVYNNDEEIDEQALADYDNFIDELLGELDYNDFKLLRASESKSSATSRYYTLADEHQVDDGNIKFIIFLRVSEHHAMLDEDQREWVRKQRQKDLDTFKLPKSKKKQRYKLREIIVNNDTYSSYDDAIEDAVKKIQEWKTSIK